MEQERIWDGRVIRAPCFNYEFGSRTVRELTDDPKLEDEDKFVEYFKSYLYGKGAQATYALNRTLTEAAYKCYVCEIKDQQEPIVIIIQGKDKTTTGPTVAKKMQSRKVMLISKKVAFLSPLALSPSSLLLIEFCVYRTTSAFSFHLLLVRFASRICSSS